MEQLRRQYPLWQIWRGFVTGDYWAMPPRGHPTQQALISAGDIDDLALRLTRASSAEEETVLA